MFRQGAVTIGGFAVSSIDPFWHHALEMHKKLRLSMAAAENDEKKASEDEFAITDTLTRNLMV